MNLGLHYWWWCDAARIELLRRHLSGGKLMTWRFLEQILNPSSLSQRGCWLYCLTLAPQLGVRSKCNVNVWKVFTFWSQQQQRRRIGAAAATAASERREGPLWAARNGWVGPPYLRANIAISCQPCASIYCSRWYVHAAQNEPIMNIFHCRGRGTSEHAETIWDPRGVDQAKAH